MSLVPSPVIPAGWYPDPQGSFQQRWWNGTSWTNEFAQYRPTLNYTPAVQEAVDHASPAQLQAAAQVAAAQSAYAEARLAEAQAKYDTQYGTVTALAPTLAPTLASALAPALAPTQSPTPSPTLTLEATAPAQVAQVAPQVAYAPIPQFPSAMPSASSAALVPSAPIAPQQPSRAVNPSILEAYQPFGMIPQVRTGVRDKPRKRHTVPAFLLALAPAALIAAALALALYLPAFYTLFAVVAIGAVLIAVLVGLAAADRRQLHDAGHDAAAWPILGIIPPVYFISRTVVVARETGRGSALPLVLSVAVLVGIAATLVLVPSVLALLVGVH